MNPYKAELLAKQLIQEHLPYQGWRFQFTNAKRTFGVCSYDRATISLSRPLTIANDEAEVRNTILHEIAHALAPGHGHNHVWKQVCHRIGARPERCYDSEAVKMPNAPYGLYCPTCDEVIADRFRRTKTLYLHNQCMTQVEWITYG